MLPFSEVEWPKISTSTEDPIVYSRSKNIPIYLKVTRDSHLVYRYYRRDYGGDWGTLTMKGFDEEQEITFLPLGKGALVEIALSRSATVSSFSGTSYAIPRPFEVIGHTIPQRVAIKKYAEITDPVLERRELVSAFLVDKEKWRLASRRVRFDEEAKLQECKVSLNVTEADLYLLSTDIEALKEDLRKEGERHLHHYPFEHAGRMPGIYWMFQAAYVHNSLKTVSNDGIIGWLKKNAPEGTYAGKSYLTAKKFVLPKLDRGKGGAPRGNFDLEALGEWADRKLYEFPFASNGLSYVLAIADLWSNIKEDPNSDDALRLAEKLASNRFGGRIEIRDLVYLIGGYQMTDEQLTLFQKRRKVA